ncbi:MAG TPA: hypothetical protein VMD03_07305 [Steroidobacteraceae bacterium]|nr:hypothetical protein [Steroidobacteraceae bacterium]
MDEVQLIRRQIDTERQHLRAAATALAAAARTRDVRADRGTSGDTSCAISESYERYLLTNREPARCAAHLARLGARGALSPPERTALAQLQDSLTRLRGRVGAAAATDRVDPAELAQLTCEWIESAESLEALAERRYTVDDWRAIAQIDADWILEERRLWAQLLSRVAAR